MNDIHFEAFEELRLQNFGVFHNARLVLDELTLLVGRNGAGKSTVLEAFEFMRDAVGESLRTAVEQRGGFRELFHRPLLEESPAIMSMAIVMRVRVAGEVTRIVYGFTLETQDSEDAFQVTEEVLKVANRSNLGFWRRGIQFDTKVAGVSPSLSDDGLLLPLISAGEPLWRSCEDALRGVRAYSIAPVSLRLEPPIGNQRGLHREGHNLGDVLNRLQGEAATLQWITSTLSVIAEGIVGVRARAAAGRRIIEFEQTIGSGKVQVFPASQMSDGTLRCLAVLVALRQEPAPTLTFIDELEDSIHPMALFAMMDAVVSSLDRTQVVLTSHSPDLLMHRAVTEARTRMLLWSRGVSNLYNVLPAPSDASGYAFSVGELLQSNALPHQQHPVQVEGDIFAEAP